MVTLKDVSRVRLEKAQRNHEAYKAMWEQCSKAILARVKRDERSDGFKYIVSPFFPGHPLLDVRRAARYVTDKLTRNGFQVEPLDSPPFVVLFVSWGNNHELVAQELLKTRPGKQEAIVNDFLTMLARRK